MKSHPMIFTAESVLAILEGRKTQTRRILKPQPKRLGWNEGVFSYGAYWEYVTSKYQPGDLIWGKETFIAGVGVGGYAPGIDPNTDPNGKTIDLIFRADDGPNERSAGPWKSPRFMPRAASRITLEVVSTRIERLQSISHADCEAEGIEYVSREAGFPCWRNPMCSHSWYGTAYDAYKAWFNKIHGPGAWERNDWVTATTFKCKVA